MDLMDNTSAIWKALADPTRRTILDLLRKESRTTGAIAAEFPELSRFAVMKHLGVLEEAQLIVVRRSGRERWNHLNAVPLRQMYERWISTLDDQWAASMLDIARLSESAATQNTHAPNKEKPMTDTQTLQQFSIAQEHRIAADVSTIFTILTTRVSEWWKGRYRLHDGDAEIRLDPRPGGVLGEYWDDDSFAIWGTVSRFEPNRTLELTGPCGMAGAVHGTFCFSVEADDGSTLLKLTHDAIGTISSEQQAGYDRGWIELIGNLKELAEA